LVEHQTLRLSAQTLHEDEAYTLYNLFAVLSRRFELHVKGPFTYRTSTRVKKPHHGS